MYDQTIILLKKTPNLSGTIDYLLKAPDIEKWVESGITLHDGKSSCEFCKGNLDEQRLLELKAHFSKDLIKHKENIQNLLSEVQSAKLNVDERVELALYAQFRDRFKSSENDLINKVSKFNIQIQSVMDDLSKKLKTPFESMTPRSIDHSIDEEIVQLVNVINKIYNEHNTVSKNFIEEKEKSILRLKFHFAEEFVTKENLIQYESNQLKFDRKIQKYHLFLEKIQKEILRLKAVISQAQLGREKINKKIESLLGEESVQISITKVDDQDHFQLIRRDGKIAKNLSEGEKTAVAFSFFLTKLDELKNPKEAVVYIDDPMSSLDSNHIFQLAALIGKAFFFFEDGKWKCHFKQVFFSTHNFEFFSLLRDMKPETKNHTKLYLVKKITASESIFIDMPDSMSKYTSEYHFLFDVLYEFYMYPNKTDYKMLMQIPNIVRRFVELYTLTRYPKNKDSTVDQRFEKIFNDIEKTKRILKVLHYFSHANSIERIARNNDLTSDIEGAVKDLIDLIDKHDPLHMQALRESITQ